MQTYTVDIAGEPITLPIVPINQKLAISLLMVIDMGVQFGELIGKALAAKLGPLKPDIIVGAATLGIPVVIEVSRALGLDQYVIAQKSPKIHLADALIQEVQSVTSSGKQRLMLDRRAVPLLAKRRVRLQSHRNACAGTLGWCRNCRGWGDPYRRSRLGEDSRHRRASRPWPGTHSAIRHRRRQGDTNAGDAVDRLGIAGFRSVT
jgi:adenine phosphoribosyltransferase